MDSLPSGSPTLVDPMSGGPESGSHAPERRRSGGRGVVIWTLVAVVVLLLSLAVGEWAAKTQEMTRLVDGITESEAAMTQTQTAVARVIGPKGSLGDTDTAQAQEELRQAADAGLSGVKAAADQIAAVPVQPWHLDVLAAQTAYLAHNQAWQDFLAKAAEDPSVWITDDPEIEQTWNALDPILRDAVPTPAVLNLDERVASILDDGAPAGGSGGGSTIDA